MRAKDIPLLVDEKRKQKLKKLLARQTSDSFDPRVVLKALDAEVEDEFHGRIISHMEALRLLEAACKVLHNVAVTLQENKESAENIIRRKPWGLDSRKIKDSV